MRNAAWIIIAALLFSGCGYFIPARKLEDCEGLLDTYKVNLINNNTLMLQAVTAIDSLQYENELLKYELEKCQNQSKTN